MSPGNFVLEELTSDHVLPIRCKKPKARPRNKTVFISDSKFSECLRNPNDLLQSVSVLLSILNSRLDPNANTVVVLTLQSQD